MSILFCANCGTRLLVFRKALPQFNTIVDMVEQHECPEEPVELNLKPNKAHVFTQQPKGKFAKKLEDLQPTPRFPIPTLDEAGLKDRRPTKDVIENPDPLTPAPKGALDLIKGLEDIK